MTTKWRKFCGATWWTVRPTLRYMAELTREEEESNKVKEDWKFVAMVLDRWFSRIGIMEYKIYDSKTQKYKNTILQSFNYALWYGAWQVFSTSSILFEIDKIVRNNHQDGCKCDPKLFQTFLVDFFNRGHCRHCRHHFTGEVAHSGIWFKCFDSKFERESKTCKY